MIKLRKAQLRDLDKITEIRRISLPDPWSKDLFLKTYNQYPESFIVAEENNEIVGHAVGKIENNSARIISLIVDPKCREKGTGTALVESLIEQFKEKNVKEVCLNVRTWNEEASVFYKNLGFKVVKTTEKHYPNGDDAYFMKKILGG